MNSLVTRFEVISAMLSHIKESPEWAEYCEKATAGLNPEDENYTIDERTFASIERDVNYFLEKSNFADEEEIENDFEPVNFFISQQEF